MAVNKTGDNRFVFCINFCYSFIFTKSDNIAVFNSNILFFKPLRKYIKNIGILNN